MTRTRCSVPRRGLPLALAGVLVLVLGSGCSSGSSPRTASSPPPSLAPAGPAPGGTVGEDEDAQPPQAERIAEELRCADVEGQGHDELVAAQLSCRRDTDRLYVATFTQPARRAAYQRTAIPVFSHGWYVVGPTWLVQVESRQVATEVQRTLGGTLQRIG
jgi:hypothetical protein